MASGWISSWRPPRSRGAGAAFDRQRQRLALARGFLKNPPILILDEATSGLDSEVENLIHDAVRRLMKGRTSFLIAHRLASAVDADVIVVLDGGRIAEVGSHSELVKRAGVYSQL